MKDKCIFGIFFILFLLLMPNVFAAYDITLKLNKPAYGPNERIEIYGTLITDSTPVNNTNVTLSVGSTNYTLTTSSDGVFYSRSDYYPTATLVSAPSTVGNYTVTASYLNTSAYVSINVIPLSVDNILIDMDKGNYFAYELITMTIKTRSGNQPVPSVSVNGSIKNSEDEIVSGSDFDCTTDSNGERIYSLVAPSTSGKYSIQTDDGLGYSVFWVNPFDVDIFIKDSTATSNTYVFKRGDEGYVNVIVTYNSTTPTGTYTVTGVIVDVNGTTMYTLNNAALNQNNSYSTNMPFTLNNNFRTGSYRASITVTQTDGETVTKYSTYFEVRDWTLSIEKTSTDSGFEYGYTAFPNRTVFFEAFPTDKSTSNTITDLENNFTISLKNNFGVGVANATTVYNSQCSCYKFNFTTSSITGSYILSVSVYYNETQTVEKIITVTDTTASASTTDVSGSSRDAFTSEAIYIKPILSNSTNSSFYPADAEIISVMYENGTSFSYTNVSSWNLVNLTNDVYEWSWNSTSKMIKMDAPNIGGLYKVEVGVNNRSVFANTQFIKKPYIIRASFKNSEDVSVTNDYWWQFKTTDTVYAHLAVIETDVNTITNLTSSGGGNATGGMWGVGSAPSLDSNTENAVVNASITMKVYHTETGKEEKLNTTNSLCKATNTDGKYVCIIQQNESTWTGGGHRVEFTVTGSDGTVDNGVGYFEARAFYIYGWPQNWRNKPNSTVTLNINAYVAGSDWWSARSAGGIDGTVALEKIEYLGTGEYWLRSPVKYDYNTTGMNTTALSNGQGTLDLPQTRAPGNQWKSGSYMAVVKVTETSSGTVDYGRIWFEVRNWDVWAQPAEISGGNIQYRWQFNNYEDVSLYVIINNAGEWGQAGNSLGGNVTIGVKSIKNYITWPPKDLNSSKYTYTNITVNESNSYFWGNAISGATYGKYVINITPTERKWDSGYYTVILDVNGTETGYAWFSAIAFHVYTQPVDENGTYSYTSRGRRPLYFNIETTKNYRWGRSYSASDYVNTTIKELTLRRWDRTTYQQVEYKHPDDINISVVNSSTLTINGTGRLNITLNSGGNWPSGYYNGEIVLEDVNGSKGNGWLWVDVRPFRIHFGTAGSWSYPTIGLEDNLTGTLGVYEPSWRSWNILTGNYTIDNISQEEWTMSGRQITYIANYTPSASHTFNGSVNANIQPNAGGWTGSYTWKTLRPTVSDNESNTETGYISFRALPALITISRTSNYDISTSANVTINITVTDPTNTSMGSALNLTFIQEWRWDPSTSRSIYTTYNFSVGSCNSATAGSEGCIINSTTSDGGVAPVTVTITPPSSGWSEGYHYPRTIFSRTDQQTTYNQWDLCNWNAGGCSINFRATEPIRGYMYAYNWRNAATDNVTMRIYSLTYINESTATVNVTQVQYAKQVGNCWSDSCRVYSNINFNVTDWSGAPTGSNSISGSGYITLIKPSGDWEVGEYYTKVTVQSGSDIARIKDGYFRIVDMTPPNVTIVSPSMGQVINASTSSSFVISATTLENTRCYADLLNYDTYYSWYCGGGNTTNTTTCNNTLYNGTTYYFKYITAWCYSGANCMSTGGTSHTYTQSVSGMPNQDYAIKWWCYDDDWNYATNVTVFTIVGLASTNITIGSTTLLSPSNGSTVTSTTVNFTWYETGNASNYTFQLSNSSAFSTFVNNTNTTTNTTTITNLVDDTTYYWRVRGFNGSVTGNWSGIWHFTVNTTIAPNITLTLNSTRGNYYYVNGSYANFTVNTNITGLEVNLTTNISGWVNQTDVAPLYNITQIVCSENNTWYNITGYWRGNSSYASDSETHYAICYFNNTAPQWSSLGTNSTLAGNATLFYVYWTDDTALSGYIFSTNNTGSWGNDSWQPMTGTGNWSNVTSHTLNSTVGLIIGWRVYANDSNNAWNNTGIRNLTTT